MAAKGPIDITLLAGSRPSLLKRTLESFAEHIFPNFQISKVFANIDPFMGTPEDGERCKQLILGYFPRAEVTMPTFGNFGLAVQNLWLKISSSVALHLEDDWIVLEKVTSSQVFPLFDDQVRMVSLFTPIEMKYRKFRRGKFKTIRKRVPYTPFRKTRPYFTLSPCFVEMEFAREYARLMDPSLCPEAQNYLGGYCYNPELYKYCSSYQNALIKGRGNLILTIDTGRLYRIEHDLSKKRLNGACIWTKRN